MSRWTPILDVAKAARTQFRLAWMNPSGTQATLLRSILTRNAQSEFGRDHGFASIKTVNDFRSRVPVRSYEKMQTWIERAATSRDDILTSDRPIAFEETGGSTGGRKLIPCTPSGLQSFRDGILPWLGDLAESRPGAFHGSLYVAMSPVTRIKRTTATGIPVGSVGDAAYLGADLAASFSEVLAVPAPIGELTDVEEWRFLTLFHLLRCQDLTFVSIFSPTFLIGLIEALPQLAETLVRALRDGTICTPGDPMRAHRITKALAKTPVATDEIWPRLNTISTWADGASAVYANRLRRLFPNVYVQPKGLMATEGIVSFPWGGTSGPVPALTSAFVEFVGEDGDYRLCHELREDHEYRIILTTASGLYRYDLGDRVLCQRWADGAPRLEFIGRGGAASDLVGEKLTEHFVASAIRRIGYPACLIARTTPNPFYELLVEAPSEAFVPSFAAMIDKQLKTNPQYAYARALGQLGAVKGRLVQSLVADFTQACTRNGSRLGDIKPPTLITNPTIAATLTAHGQQETNEAISNLLTARTTVLTQTTFEMFR
jgi:hypothetical protein